MNTTLTASTQNGSIELRQDGCTWQVLVKPTGESAFHLTAAGSLSAQPDTVTIQKLRLDRSLHKATLDGKELKLTPTEFTILSLLASEPTRFFRRDEMLGDNSALYKLKAKLGPGYIFNRPRVGWSLLP